MVVDTDYFLYKCVYYIPLSASFYCFKYHANDPLSNLHFLILLYHNILYIRNKFTVLICFQDTSIQSYFMVFSFLTAGFLIGTIIFTIIRLQNCIYLLILYSLLVHNYNRF